jgi:hypothetical protein
MRTQEEYCVFIIKKNKKKIKKGGRRNSSYIQCVGIIIFEIWNNEWNQEVFNKIIHGMDDLTVITVFCT